MKTLSRSLLLLLLLALSSVAVLSQDQIPESKRKLIAELAGLMKMDKLAVEMTDAMLKGIETAYPNEYESSINSIKGLSEDRKAELARQLAESSKRVSTKLRERFAKEIDYAAYFNETIYPLYDKFFNEQELGDLVAFYRTPTGAKTIDVAPKLFEESIKIAGEKLVPKLRAIADEVVAEEMELIDASQPPPPKPAKKPGRH